MSDYAILDSCWFTPVGGNIGIVAVRTGLHDPDRFEWKAYIGIGTGLNVEADEQLIAAMGMSLQPEEARGFFPYLDIDKYKRDKE